MSTTKRTLQRIEKSAVVFGFIREKFNHCDTFPNPLIALCLLFYDSVHYVDFYGNKLKKWINAEPGNVTKSPIFTLRTQYGRIGYRIHSGCEQRKRPGSISFKVRSIVKQCHMYFEIRLNGKLIQKGYKIVDFKHKPRFKIYPELLWSAELRQIDGITFEVYIELLKVIPRNSDQAPMISSCPKWNIF